MGGKATWKLEYVNDKNKPGKGKGTGNWAYVPYVFKGDEETGYPGGAINLYKKDGKTINLNQLRLIDNKTKDN